MFSSFHGAQELGMAKLEGEVVRAGMEEGRANGNRCTVKVADSRPAPSDLHLLMGSEHGAGGDGP